MTLILQWLAASLVALAGASLYEYQSTSAMSLADNTTILAFWLVASLALFIGKISFSIPSSSRSSSGSASSHQDGSREYGSVKWFNPRKGFGFITCEDESEIFVHQRALGESIRNLKPGQKVSFTIADSEKGPQAQDVKPD
ncbi:MAG: cold shock domain-containing protein [Pseudomonadales bacterium]